MKDQSCGSFSSNERKQTIVTVLCDSGHKYQSTLFNRDWLASNHLNPDLPLGPIIGG